MDRLIQPEILDSLDFDDPRALSNRRDLQILNQIMGNFRWFEKELSLLRDKLSILELGAGDGLLGLHLLQKGVIGKDDQYEGIDLWPCPSHWPSSWHWRQEDLLDAIPDPSTNCLLANLILHQFTNEELQRFCSKVESSAIKYIFISEPLRHRRFLWLLPAIRLLGMHDVTLHDAGVSIRAGFRKLEACSSLGLNPERWKMEYRHSILGANRVICRRI